MGPISYFDTILVISDGQLVKWTTRWLSITTPLLLLLLVTLLPTPVTCAAHPSQPLQATASIPHLIPHSNINYISTNMMNNPYTNATHQLLLDLRQQLITRALKFDEHFRNLLSKSKLSLHNMFLDTYGMIYLHNTDIFTSMYEGLEQYYATGRIKLTKSMESFFERLYQKIFQVYNSNRAFTPSYLECATEQLAQLKPFKDAPDKLIGDIRHAFVAARTFNQALNSGIDIIKSIISLGQPTQCTNLISEKLLRQRQLFIEASGEALSLPRPPCLGFCEQVISRCIGRANLEPLNDRWKAYVVSLSELAKKLSVQYNIETIIGPIDVQISEAIMNFQENAQNITAQVFQACGRATMQEASLNPIKPVPNRLGKRAASVMQPPVPSSHILPSSSLLSPSSSSSNFMVNTARRSQQQAPASLAAAGPGQFGRNPLVGVQQLQTAAPAPTLAPTMGLYGRSNDDASSSLMSISKRSPIIINDIRDYMLSTKNFWSNLPNLVCTSTNQTIFAGAGTGGIGTPTLGAVAYANQMSIHHQNQNYMRKQQQQQQQQHIPTCFQEQLSLSDMNSDLRYRNEIQHQVNRLEAINSKIADALRGVEIDWTTTSATGGVDLIRQQPAQPAIIVAPPSPSPPLPATVATDEPSEHTGEQGEDEEPDDPDNYEGSGDGPDPDNENEEDDEYTSTTPENEDGEPGEDEDDPTQREELPNNADPESTSPSDLLLPETTGKPSVSDFDQKQSLDMISNGLITAYDQNAQKSSASDNSVAHIVIHNQLQLVFGLFIVCALSITSCFHNHNNNHRVLSRHQFHH